MFSALLLTKAVLFIGYSLNDPDFRLLLDRQLTVFRGNIPDRYALMSGVGRVERDVLWRTARIRVISYDEGKHEQVLEFLRELQTQVAGTPAVAAAPPPQAAVPAPPPPAPAARSAPKKPKTAKDPVRLASVSPVTLTIRIRSQKLEANLVADDVNVQAAGASVDWTLVRSVLG